MSHPDATAPVETVPTEPAPTETGPVEPAITEPGTAEPAITEPAEPGRSARFLGRAVPVAGLVISMVAALVTALLELLLAPLRLGGTLIGVAVLVAVVANLAICWFAVTTVGRRWAVGPPWVVWTLAMFFAVGMRTDEGDYLVAGDNWVGLVMILLGSLVFAGYLYRLILSGPPPVPARAATTGEDSAVKGLQ